MTIALPAAQHAVKARATCRRGEARDEAAARGGVGSALARRRSAARGELFARLVRPPAAARRRSRLGRARRGSVLAAGAAAASRSTSRSGCCSRAGRARRVQPRRHGVALFAAGAADRRWCSSSRTLLQARRRDRHRERAAGPGSPARSSWPAPTSPSIRDERTTGYGRVVEPPAARARAARLTRRRRRGCDPPACAPDLSSAADDRPRPGPPRRAPRAPRADRRRGRADGRRAVDDPRPHREDHRARPRRRAADDATSSRSRTRCAPTSRGPCLPRDVALSPGAGDAGRRLPASRARRRHERRRPRR